MSWVGEALKSLKKVILIEEKVATVREAVKSLSCNTRIFPAGLPSDRVT